MTDRSPHWGRLVASTVGVALLSVAATWSLHERLVPTVAVLAVLVAGAVTASMRSSWSTLPAFVGGWLDAGAWSVGVLVVVASSGLTQGLAVTVLRLPRTLTLFAAAALVGSVLLAMAYTHIRLQQDVQATTERLTAVRQQALESRLAALSAQINPHFLFNTLNTLAEIVHEDEDQAEDLITDLAAMMRYALDHAAEHVTVAAEMDVVGRLLRLESVRLGERLAYELRIDPIASSARLPALLVQPLVENALQHAIADRVEGGRLEVVVRREGDRVVVEVVDDGPGLPAAIRDALDEERAGAAHLGGLRNVVERTRLTWRDAHVSFSDPPGLTVTLSFPAESS